MKLKLSDDDIDPAYHELEVDNGIDRDPTIFRIYLDTGRNCQDTQDPGRGDEGFCDSGSGGSNSEIEGIIDQIQSYFTNMFIFLYFRESKGDPD